MPTRPNPLAQFGKRLVNRGEDAEIDHIVVLVDPKTALMAICARHRGFSIDARDRHACRGDQGRGEDGWAVGPLGPVRQLAAKPGELKLLCCNACIV